MYSLKNNFNIKSEPLKFTEAELKILDEVFGNSIDLNKVKLRLGGILSWGSTKVIGNIIYINKFSSFIKLRGKAYSNSLLVHETVHVWQYHRIGIKYALKSIYDQFRGFLKTGSRGAAYKYSLEPNKKLVDYGIEQQAQIIQDYWFIKKFKSMQSAKLNCKNLDSNSEKIYSELFDQIKYEQ